MQQHLSTFSFSTTIIVYIHTHIYSVLPSFVGWGWGVKAYQDRLTYMYAVYILLVLVPHFECVNLHACVIGFMVSAFGRCCINIHRIEWS